MHKYLCPTINQNISTISQILVHFKLLTLATHPPQNSIYFPSNVQTLKILPRSSPANNTPSTPGSPHDPLS